ncbi:P-type conjugative transfer protein TrbJ [Vulcaniibacterium tengchongense]|uniref:P-type conjugative transfer protein TrbJ n=1 Tax=Vulcaniibacterium tengchongense TaxID=1273429 RepID=A0A3N4VG69_9GAMM|nr:P-type conjugative transfer protein TrbJ [Vulcaniibacterium tengchongense]RPE82066.1 P-type conjugative transfer protein TrbJ [Vulcaniibacterium tengchongense]
MTNHAFRALSLAFATTLGTAALTIPTPATAQWVVIDPTNYVQNFLTQLRAVQSNINEAQQIRNQIQQYQNMLQNTRGLQAKDLNSFIDALGRLDGVMQEGKSLAVTVGNYEQAFKAKFPGYKPQKNYSESYREWNETARDSVLGAMRVANMQIQGIQSESQAINALKSAAQSADGQKSAIDAGNQIALAQIEQLQQLRELMVAQMQSEGTHLAAEQQAEAAKATSIREATRYRDPREGWKPKPIKIGN